MLLLVVALHALTRADQAGIGGYGLISTLPVLSLVCMAGLLGVFTVAWCSGLRASSVNLPCVLLLVVLVSAPALVESRPRFATAWLHAGITEYLLRTGEILPDYDARFSWPAFFALAAVFSEITGLEPLSLLRWAPLVLSLLYLLPLALIFRALLPDQSSRSLALMLWVLGNWVGQDYFAPQGLNVFFYLTFVGVILVALCGEARPAAPARRLLAVLRVRASEWLPGPALDARMRSGLLAVVLVLYAASVVSHQLTQFFMLGAATALAVLGVLRLRRLPALLVLMTVAYILWGAEDYWAGHLGELIGGVGDLGTSLQENVAARVSAGGNLERDVVLRARIAMTVVMLALAALALLRRRSRALVVPAVLAAAPYPVLALQSYGGEGLLRVHLASLPFLVVVAAQAWRPGDVLRRGGLPPRGPRAVLQGSLVALGLSILTVGYLLARYGNESFEQMRESDVAAVQAFYATAPVGSTLFVLADPVPFRYRALEDYGFAVLRPAPWTVDDVEASIAPMERVAGAAYLLVTQAQLDRLRAVDRLAPDVIDDLVAELAHSPSLDEVWTDGHATLYSAEPGGGT